MTEIEFRKRLKQVKYFSNWKAKEVMVTCKKAWNKEKQKLISEFLKDLESTKASTFTDPNIYIILNDRIKKWEQRIKE